MDIKRMNNQLDQIAFEEAVCLPVVNFTNILGAAFSYKSCTSNFSAHFRFVYFWQNEIGIKAVRKMLVLIFFPNSNEITLFN